METDEAKSVYLQSLLMMRSVFAPRFNSITTRKPSLSDSSLASLIPSISSLRSLILSTILDLLTLYGISVIMIEFDFSSISYTERILIFPCPDI